MHLSLERLVTTVFLLSLVLSIVPHLFTTDPTFPQLDLGLAAAALSVILRVWIIDMVAISISVDDTALSLSVIPFVCIFPVALLICAANYQAFVSVVGLTFLTIIFVIARYIANSM